MYYKMDRYESEGQRQTYYYGIVCAKSRQIRYIVYLDSIQINRIHD